MVGSLCAIYVASLCLTLAFAGCLNPLTDDQPAVNAAPGDDSDNPSNNGNASSGSPGDFLTDEGVEPSPAGPSINVDGMEPPDAGVSEHDAGPDSGSSGGP